MENRERRPNLPVWETIKESVIFPLTHLRALVRLAWPLALIEGAMMMLYTPPNYRLFHEEMQRGPSVWPIWIGLLIQGVVTISWSVAWMRLVLASSESVVKLRFGRRESKYAGMMFALFLTVGVLFIILIVAVMAASLATGIIFSGANRMPNHQRIVLVTVAITASIAVAVQIIWVRFMLIFPAIALDQYRGLRASWRETRGNFWRIVAIIFAFLIPGWLFMLPFIGAMFLSYRAAFVVAGAIGGTVMVMVSAFMHTAWALIYRRLTPEEPQPLAAAQAG